MTITKTEGNGNVECKIRHVEKEIYRGKATYEVSGIVFSTKHVVTLFS